MRTFRSISRPKRVLEKQAEDAGEMPITVARAASRVGEGAYAIAVITPSSRLAQSRVKVIVDEVRKTANLPATANSAM